MKKITPRDRINPDDAASAVYIPEPPELSEYAKRVLKYFGDTAFVFIYKNKIVVTDESLLLTDNPKGCGIIGGPRWTCDTWHELNAWLRLVYLDHKNNEEPYTIRQKGAEHDRPRYNNI